MPWPLRMTVLIAVAVLPVYLYVTWRLGTAIINRWNAPRRIVRGLLLWAVGWMYLLPLQYLFTHPQNLFLYTNRLGWQDYVFLYPFWLGMIIVVEVLIYFVLIDVAFGLVVAFNLKYRQHWQRGQEYMKIILVVFFLFYVPIRAWIDTNHPRISNSKITLEGIPEQMKGLRLSLLGDVQVDRYTQHDKLKAMQKRLQVLDNDFLFFAGDIVTSGRDYISQALQVVCAAEASVAKVACLGDHDFWSDSEGIAQGLQACGWEFLDNQHQVFTYRQKTVLVTGLTHIYSRTLSQPQLEAVFAAAPQADLKIILVHQPARHLTETAERFGYHLFLAGHTHGGQIVFKPFGIPLTPSLLEGPYYSGSYAYGGMQIVVTNGIGLTLAPLRYRSRAEISHLLIAPEP